MIDLSTIHGLLWAFHIVWLVSWAFVALPPFWGRSVPPLARWVFNEGRPLMPVAIIAVFLIDALLRGTDGMAWRIVALAIWMWNWWRSGRDKDDRWKRRKRKLHERVARVGTKLVAVPT